MIDRRFDEKLKTIAHYRAYPAMMPYVGANYESLLHGKLLLLGESNYLPSTCVAHHDVQRWYDGSESRLSKKEEVPWIDNRGLLEGEWDPRTGHAIYCELNRCLLQSKVLPASDDRATSHVSYMNTFQRPAVGEGAGFRHCCTDDDVEKAAEVVNKVISILEPEIVIFVSKFAWDRVNSKIQPKGAYIGFTCHPATPFWWRRQTYEHGRNKFIKLLQTEWAQRVQK